MPMIIALLAAADQYPSDWKERIKAAWETGDYSHLTLPLEIQDVLFCYGEEWLDQVTHKYLISIRDVDQRRRDAEDYLKRTTSQSGLPL